MNRADNQDMVGSRSCAANHVGLIAMSMHEVWPQPRNQSGELAVLPPVTPCPNYDGGNWDAERLNSSHEGMLGGFARREDCGDVHRFIFLSRRQHRDNTLKSTFSHRSKNMEHAHSVIHSECISIKLRSAIEYGAPKTDCNYSESLVEKHNRNEVTSGSQRGGTLLAKQRARVQNTHICGHVNYRRVKFRQRDTTLEQSSPVCKEKRSHH